MRRLSLVGALAISVLLSAVWLGLPAESNDPGYVLQTFEPENSFVVMPGETRLLRARIQRQDGSGVPGVSIIFGAPTQGPSGTFANATGPSGSFVRLQTDEGGNVAAMLTTNQIEGVFEVGIEVEGLAGFNNFSFTNTSSLPTTAAAPQQVREEAHEVLLGNAVLGPGRQLHGPVFVAAGSIIKAPAPPDAVSQVRPILVERDSWLMWIDEAPTGFFAHEAQWILMDVSLSAEEAVAAAEVFRVRWYPVVVPPSLDREWTLFYPAGSHPEAFNEELHVPVAGLSAKFVPPAVEQGDGNPCIIAIRGPGLRGAHNDIRRYIDTFSEIGDVAPNHVFTNGFTGVNEGVGDSIGYNPVSTSDIRKLVEAAAAVPCTKVYFMMSSHGLDRNVRGSGNHPGGGVITTDRPGPGDLSGRPENPLSFDELANILKGLEPEGGPEVELCLFQNGCYTGQMKEWIQGLGLNGQFVSPSDEDHMAWEEFNGSGSIYLRHYLEAKMNSAADADNDGEVSDLEATQYIRENVAPDTQSWNTGASIERVHAPGPTWCPIFGNISRWIGSDEAFLAGPNGRDYICVRRPMSMPDDARYEGRVLIINDGVAVDRRFDPAVEEEGVSAHRIEFELKPGQDSVKVPQLQATGCGVSRYEIAGRVTETSAEGERQQTYFGGGRIQSGHFTVVCPNGPTPDAGAGSAPPSVSEITIAVGETKTIVLKFHGRQLNPTSPANTDTLVLARSATINAFSRNEDIATVNPAEVMKSGLVNEVEVMITGGPMTGTTKVGLTLTSPNTEVTGGSKEITVNVVAASSGAKDYFLDPSDEDEQSTEADGQVTRTGDMYNHEDVVGRLRRRFRALINVGSRFDDPQQGADTRTLEIIMGPKPHFLDLRGTVSAETGQFNVSGRGRVSPFSNVPATGRGRIPLPSASLGVQQAAANAFDMTYTLGRGVFPNAPITYTIRMTPVEQGGGCEYELTADPRPSPFTGAFRTAVVKTGPGCEWTATSDSEWLLLENTEGPVRGSGPGSLHLTVLNNSGGAARTATLTVEGLDATLMQEGADATRPVIAQVSNGASFARGVTGGSWITIEGFNLAETTRIWGDGDFNGANLPRTLDGVSVTVNGAPAYPFFISPGQLNVLTDDSLATQGVAEIVVTNAMGVSEAFRANAVRFDPALFVFDPEGRRFAAAVHADTTLVARPGLFPGANTRAASSGDIVQFFGTGFAETDPPRAAGILVQQPAPLANPVIFRIGGREARVRFAGLVSSGLYQFNVDIPDGLEPGDHLVEVYVNGVPIQAGVYITVG